ncbi:uncharacterized protein LOC143886312 [Tasmannia lanceolata]|uniref:uncharacterized protein LOC143886312 n=1 Tax=Tasmannia lanceolata TaxID=3420 RepID=UPI00406454BB
MSEPPNTSSSDIVLHHHQPPPFSGQPSTSDPTPSSSLTREYHKGNWTLHETLILITAKKLNDERRSKGPTPIGPTTTEPTKPSSNKTLELRWKWVENYCWNNNCLRSQNQCNDKWDNLLRDYKKIRDYESRSNGQDRPSYWQLEKHQRKDLHLPSNLLFEVFQALHDVVNKKQPQMLPSLALPLTTSLQKTPIANITRSSLPPPPPSLPTIDPSETEGSGSGSDSGSKRRKVRTLGSSIVRAASVLGRTLEACEEKNEKRHRDVVELEERKIRIEEDRTEHNRQGIAELVTAVNNLSNAVHALVSDRHDTRVSDRHDTR